MKRTFLILMVIGLLPLQAFAETPEPLEHQQPTIATNARHLLPQPEDSGVSVISHSVSESNDSIGIVILNNTGETVSIRHVKANVINRSGELAGVATAPGGAFINPDVLAPGDIASGYMHLFDVSLPSEYTISFEVNVSVPDRLNDLAPAMEFEDVKWTGDAFVGTIVNPSEMEVSIVNFSFVCVGEDGSLHEYGSDFQSIFLDPDDSSTFQVSPMRDIDCENFVLGGNSA